MDQDRYLVLKGCAGLGNRLMTLAWAIPYALAKGRVLAVDWSDGMFAGKGTNPFFDYFVLKEVPHIVSVEKIGDLTLRTVYPEVWKTRPTASIYDLYDGVVPFPVWKRRCVRILSGGRWQVTGTWILKREFQSEALRCAGLPLLGAILSGRKLPILSNYPKDLEEEVIFGTDYLPRVETGTLRRHVALRSEVEARFLKVAADLGIGQSTVGVHVRQTDWEWQADLDRLLARLRGLPKETSVFLATDSAGALEEVRRVVPSVRIQPKFLPKPKEGGLHHWAYHSGDSARIASMFEESLIDLFLLSRCGTFWFQGGSTFSEVACVWADPGQHAEDWSRSREASA